MNAALRIVASESLQGQAFGERSLVGGVVKVFEEVVKIVRRSHSILLKNDGVPDRHRALNVGEGHIVRR